MSRGAAARTLQVAALAVTLLASTTAHAQRVQRREVALRVGEQTTVPANNVAEYSEGVGGIVDVRVAQDGGQFVLVGMRAGQTTLLLIMNNGRQVQYRITVTAADATAALSTDNIRLDFYFLQLAENYGHQIGVGWPSAIGDGFQFNANLDVGLASRPAGFTNATAVITNQALPRIDLLETSGWARVVRQAAVVTLNGTEANLFSGEEINIVVPGGLSGQLTTVKFGADVRVTPRYDRSSGRIDLTVSTEMSELTSGRGTGVPGRTLMDVNGRVSLEMGQAIVLGGSVAESSSGSQTGLPGLSQIPIIGILFGTHSARREYTQSVVFIVPTVVDVVSQQARRRIADALQVYWDYSGDLYDIQLVGSPPEAPSAAHPDSQADADEDSAAPTEDGSP